MIPLHKRLGKRVFDLLVAGSLLLLLSPLVLMVALAVFTTSGSPVVFTSCRLGRHEKPFSMPKFRSMRNDSPLIPTPHFGNVTDFITPFGRFMRDTSLDELPQLWSVVKGDMSLVGPRPLLITSEEAIHNQRKKFGVYELKPGMTGWAQVNGRANITMQSKLQLDCEYLLRQSVGFDAKILFHTLLHIINSGHFGLFHKLCTRFRQE